MQYEKQEPEKLVFVKNETHEKPIISKNQQGHLSHIATWPLTRLSFS